MKHDLHTLESGGPEEIDSPVGYEVRDRVAWIVMRRPRYANAQNSRMTYALDDAFKRAVDDDSVGAIVLCGDGRNFSSGHDIGSPGRDVGKSWSRRGLWYDHVDKPGAEGPYSREQEVYLQMCHRWRALPKPTIAMVHGACIGGGLALAWICDLCVASEDAYFQDPVLAMGIPGIEYFAHSYEMPARIAKEFLFLGRRFSASRAYELGMVNRVVPFERLRDEATEIARRLSEVPRFALALAKQSLNHADDLRGKRLAIDAAFHAHHLAHAQNLLTVGETIIRPDKPGGKRTDD